MVDLDVFANSGDPDQTLSLHCLPSTLLGVSGLNGLTTFLTFLMLIVCIEVLRPSQPNGIMLSAVNLPNHTFTGQA